MMGAVLLLALVTASRLDELVLARSNTADLLRHGGTEVAAGHYPLIVLLHAAWLGTLWVLGWNQPVHAVWLGLFLLLQLGRIWPLPVVDAPGLRPSSDRVRVTVFNWIGHFFPDLEACSGLDLFAGTGALGFELASRGASRVILVERNPVLVAGLQRMKQKLNAEAVTVVAGDAMACVRPLQDRSFDIVFLDPPFDGALLHPALEAAARVVSVHGVIYVESGAPLERAAATKLGLQVVRAARAGQVHFHLLQRA